MTASQKYSEEKDELKTARMNRILAAAFELFSEHGIDTIAMTDIAKKAEIGVASLYRYYETKDMIAIKTAMWAWNWQKNNIMPVLASDDYINAFGLIQLEKICQLFEELYENQSDFLRFIYFFDSYMVRQNIQKEKLTDYEKIIITVQEIVSAALEKGLSDGSISPEYKQKEKTLYFSLMHTLFSTVQKLSLSGRMLSMDSIVSGKEQLEVLTKIIIDGLKNKTD